MKVVTTAMMMRIIISDRIAGTIITIIDTQQNKSRKHSDSANLALLTSADDCQGDGVVYRDAAAAVDDNNQEDDDHITIITSDDTQQWKNQNHTLSNSETSTRTKSNPKP